MGGGGGRSVSCGKTWQEMIRQGQKSATSRSPTSVNYLLIWHSFTPVLLCPPASKLPPATQPPALYVMPDVHAIHEPSGLRYTPTYG
mmetsp:Transcript_86375/g.150518  ORF Transcript_86375/g.150518 Transcript_86375/m.150518 type:complete len:87 (-) Transcript_86375:430-690(-)